MGEILIHSFIAGLKPEPLLTVTQWAELNKKLDSKGSAEPGPYRVARVPYLRKPQDTLSFSCSVIKVVGMKGIQGGWTEMGFNFLGYGIDCVPCPMMYVMPTVETMERNVKQRIDPMIDNCPALLAKVGKKRSKDGGNTLKQKDGPGFVLIMTGANSAAGLRSIAVRILVMDEVDGYPGDVDGEGSPVALAENRQVTFGAKKKTLMFSTPTIEGESRIEAEFLLTDQQYYFVPCVHCEGLQTLEFEQLRWEKGKYDDVYYQCIHCGGKFYNRHKTWFLQEKGYGGLAEWIATRPDLASDTLMGFHWNSLYSPDGWLSWEEVAAKWDKAENDEPERKTFVNTILGKTYKIKGDAPPWQQLMERANASGLERNKVMSTVAFITAGADVQGDRIEVEITGWMKGRISQVVDYRVYYGDTAKHDVWEQLGAILEENWEVPSIGKGKPRQMQIKKMVVDANYNTAQVHDFCKHWGAVRVVPGQGQDNLRIAYSSPKAVSKTAMGKPIGKLKTWGIGVSYLKELLYGWLKLTVQMDGDSAGEIPKGYCHLLPNDSHYFRGLTAEQMVPRKNAQTNAIRYEWLKQYARNEPLDCKIYSMAAAYIVGCDRWDDKRWDKEAGIKAAAKGKVAVARTVEELDEPREMENPESEEWGAENEGKTKKVKRERKSRGGFWK